MRVIAGKQRALDLFADRGLVAEGSEDIETVREIIAQVRKRGDEALREYSERFDGVRLDDLSVPESDFERAQESLDPALLQAIRLSVRRVSDYYRNQPPAGFIERKGESLLGQLVRPLSRVGCYVPGGTASLFSSLIMMAVPARVAGVEEIVAATPPRRDGGVPAEVLVAAREAGVSIVYRVGGAQAIAALAFGTESIPRVDKIVGPGNRFVVLAKQAVYGNVGIESLPGPTETLVLADDNAPVEHVAADLLAQAEHAGAQPVLVTTSRRLLDELQAVLERRLADLPTAAAARESLEQRGLAILVESLEEGLEVSNSYAPEHLCLLVDDPEPLLPLVRNAGGIFLGRTSMEALGDYVAGPSHVMPTGGTARFSSYINVSDFQKLIPLVGTDEEVLAEIGPAATRMARAEGLEAHARAIEERLGREGT